MVTTNAEFIAQALGGRRSGTGWISCCPAHDDRTPSLAIRDADDGKTLVHCHAGCDQSRVIEELRSRGLWVRDKRMIGNRGTSKPVIERSARADSERTASALSLWCSTSPVSGTIVEVYLGARGISIALPDSIRFHPNLKHPGGARWPALLALVTCGKTGKPIAIHRTFLARDGGGKAAVTPNKMMLGPCRGGAVRLAAAGETLMVGEGIETCLSVMQAMGLPAWAALSTSGLHSLQLPSEISEVIILADGDAAGEAAAVAAASRWKREGRFVRIARPPVGMDFNDVLMAGRTSEREVAA